MTLLWERFREFAKDTEMIGSERVNGVNDIADSLISSGHTGKDQLYSFLHCTGALKNNLLECQNTALHIDEGI